MKGKSTLHYNAAATVGLGAPIPEWSKFYLEQVEKLITAQSINERDDNGLTPLMYVAEGWKIYNKFGSVASKEMTNLLLNSGADPSLVDNNGKSTQQYFIERFGDNHYSTNLIKAKVKIKIFMEASGTNSSFFSWLPRQPITLLSSLVETEDAQSQTPSPK